MSNAIALVHGGGGGALSPPAPSGDGSRPQVQRASLKLYDSSPATGGRKLEGALGSIDFQFNPKEVTIAITRFVRLGGYLRRCELERLAEHRRGRGVARIEPPRARGCRDFRAIRCRRPRF